MPLDNQNPEHGNIKPNRPQVHVQGFHGLNNYWEVENYRKSEADAIFDAKDAEIAELVEALRSMRNEASGWVELEPIRLAGILGNTNLSVMRFKITEADAVLAKHAALPDTEEGK